MSVCVRADGLLLSDRFILLLLSERVKEIQAEREWDTSSSMKRKRRSGGADYIKPSQISAELF